MIDKTEGTHVDFLWEGKELYNQWSCVFVKMNGMSEKGTWWEWVGKEKSSVVGLWYISLVFIIKWLKNVVHGAPYT